MRGRTFWVTSSVWLLLACGPSQRAERAAPGGMAPDGAVGAGGGAADARGGATGGAGGGAGSGTADASSPGAGGAAGGGGGGVAGAGGAGGATGGAGGAGPGTGGSAPDAGGSPDAPRPVDAPAAAPDARTPDATPAPPPDTSRPPDASDCPPTAADEWIADFEDGTVNTRRVGMRGGQPFTIVNGGGTAAVASATIPARCDSQRALRFSGTSSSSTPPYTTTLFVPAPVIGPLLTLDASGFKGIRLFLRAAAPMRVRLRLPDRNTSVAGGVCSVCTDDFGAFFDITAEWRSFTVLFADMKQAGVAGADRFAAIQPGALYGLRIQAPPTAAGFEIQIDDVVFLK
jgi:hypothetical protein